jgi:hypothetical protein
MERVGLMDRREGDRSGVYTKRQPNNGVMMGKVWDHRGLGGHWVVVSLWRECENEAVMYLVGIVLFPILRIRTSDDGRCA